MKKNIVLALVALFVSTSVWAQKGEMKVGANLMYSSSSVNGRSGDGDWSNMGIGAKFQYYAMDQLVIEPSVTFFLPKEKDGVKLSFVDVGAVAQWRFPMSEQVQVYPLAGFSYLRSKVKVEDVPYVGDYSETETDFGFNIGGGAGFAMSESLELVAEIKYQSVGDYDRVVFGIGTNFKF